MPTALEIQANAECRRHWLTALDGIEKTKFFGHFEPQMANKLTKNAFNLYSNLVISFMATFIHSKHNEIIKVIVYFFLYEILANYQ